MGEVTIWEGAFHFLHLRFPSHYGPLPHNCQCNHKSSTPQLEISSIPQVRPVVCGTPEGCQTPLRNGTSKSVPRRTSGSCKSMPCSTVLLWVYKRIENKCSKLMVQPKKIHSNSSQGEHNTCQEIDADKLSQVNGDGHDDISHYSERVR
jgi:hypothetical protein